MTDVAKEITPANVDQWLEICDSMREQIRRQVPYMSAMKPEECEKFIESARSLQALEREVATQTAEVNKRIMRASQLYMSEE